MRRALLLALLLAPLPALAIEQTEPSEPGTASSSKTTGDLLEDLHGDDGPDRLYAARALQSVKEKVSLASEFPEWVHFFFRDEFAIQDDAMAKLKANAQSAALLAALGNALSAATNWDDEAVTAVTAAILKNQKENKPVHTWKETTVGDLENWHPTTIKVEEFMSTDLFTVQKDDLIELVAEIMDWRRIRYMPVEDNKGELIGLISSRMLLRHFARAQKTPIHEEVSVKDIMISKPVTVTPETSIMEAMNKMRNHRIGCLPVVKGKDLVGIITEMDFLRITSRLLERMEK
jgi:CBS domain-containing protein